MASDHLETNVIGIILEGIFYGLYCVLFWLYLRIQLKRREGFKGLLTYAITLIFILCTVFFAIELSYVLQLLRISCPSSLDPLPASVDYPTLGANTLYYCIDLISQGVLIYRCWILWRRPLIVVVPVILSLVFLAMSLLSLFSIYTSARVGVDPTWNRPATASILLISFTVNCLVTGLIISKIIIELKARGVYRLGRDLYLCISALVESGIITFIGQVMEIILWMVGRLDIYVIFSVTLPMLYGISSTVILVRVAMGLTFDTEVSRITTSHPIQFAEVEMSNNPTIQITTGNNTEDNLQIEGFNSNNKQALGVTTGMS